MSVQWRKGLAIVEGCALVALGLVFLNSSHLLVSGVAGWALIIEHWIPLSFGGLFFLLNCPFFVLSWLTLGRSFTFKSLAAIAFVSLLSDALMASIALQATPQWLAALIAGGLIGAGLTWIMRHGASLGGVNIVAVWAEHRYDLQAGQTLFAADCLVALVGAWVFNGWELLWSLMGFVVLSWVVGRYHKRDQLRRVEAEECESSRVELGVR
ncbi:YitT family protein [Hahella sp. CR1]|uniref:YitT family protein n=1 Tax=Hahella sp. CR1 TaxID=2992807 RepID=UPI00244330F6|nr:YitT family protein [Hahella sp. CR1]MDG9666963.1 YitT family protein [Hahella sp. CR1]